MQETSYRASGGQKFTAALGEQVLAVCPECICLQGFGYVEFGSNSALKKAVDLKEPELHGRMISIMLSKPPSAGPAGRGAGALTLLCP